MLRNGKFGIKLIKLVAVDLMAAMFRQNMSLATPIFVDSVFQFLLATLVLSYA
jgi:hypothetical protein